MLQPRQHFFLRNVSPELTQFNATENDQMWQCFSSIPRVTDATTFASAQLTSSSPLSKGGSGLRSPLGGVGPDHLHMVKERRPTILGDDNESVDNQTPFSHHPSRL